MPLRISLMEWQEGPVLSRKRFLSLFAGRRAGKTDAIKARIKIRTHTPRFRYTYVTPFSYQSLAVWRELMSDRAWSRRVKQAGQRPFPYARLRNGAEIQFRNFQRPEGLKGTGEDEICIDESQEDIITEFDFDTMVMPMLSDKRGTLLMAGQFRGEDWRAKRFWLRGQQYKVDGDCRPTLEVNPTYSPMFESWRFPTSVGYCFQGESGAAELALMRSICPTQAIWDQEWECVMRANANAVFDPTEIDLISIKRKVRIEREIFARRSGGYCLCIDIGGVKDPTKWILGHLSGEIVNAGSFALGLHDKVMARSCMEIAQKFHAHVVIDATGAGRPGEKAGEDRRIDFYESDARTHGLGFNAVVFGGHGRKDRFVINLRTAIQEKWIGIAHELKDVCDEWKAYECHFKTIMNAYTYSAPLGKHDDYVQCGMLFVEALRCGWIPGAGRGSIAALTY